MRIQISAGVLKQVIGEFTKAPENMRGAFLTGKIIPDEFIVNGIYIPEQESNKTGYYIESKQQIEAYMNIMAQGRDIVGFVHYNGTFTTFKEPELIKEWRRETLRRTGIPFPFVIVTQNGGYIFVGEHCLIF